MAAFAGGAWFWAMPHGFAWGHPRTLANGVFPLIFAGINLLLCISCLQRHPRGFIGSAFVPSVAIGLSAGCLVLFPRTMVPWILGAALCGLTYLLVNYYRFWKTVEKPQIMRSLCAISFASIFFGVIWATTQKALPPSPTPLKPSPL